MEDLDERPIVIDSFTSVRAIRRAQRRTEAEASKTSGQIPPKQNDAGQTKKNGARIDRTTLPKRHEITCYECDYLFILSGCIQDTMCPKCHKPLKATDHVLNGEWTQSIRTLGVIDIKEGTILNGAELRARDIILAGNTENGIIRAGRRLELLPGARLNMAKTKMKDIVVRKGCEFEFPSAISCRDLEIEGSLKARIFADGMVVIKHGGFLDGELHTPHLVVEDGGGLAAKVVIGIGKNRNETHNIEPEIVTNNQ